MENNRLEETGSEVFECTVGTGEEQEEQLITSKFKLINEFERIDFIKNEEEFFNDKLIGKNFFFIQSNLNFKRIILLNKFCFHIFFSNLNNSFYFYSAYILFTLKLGYLN